MDDNASAICVVRFERYCQWLEGELCLNRSHLTSKRRKAEEQPVFEGRRLLQIMWLKPVSGLKNDIGSVLPLFRLAKKSGRI